MFFALRLQSPDIWPQCPDFFGAGLFKRPAHGRPNPNHSDAKTFASRKSSRTALSGFGRALYGRVFPRFERRLWPDFALSGTRRKEKSAAFYTSLFLFSRHFNRKRLVCQEQKRTDFLSRPPRESNQGAFAKPFNFNIDSGRKKLRAFPEKFGRSLPLRDGDARRLSSIENHAADEPVQRGAEQSRADSHNPALAIAQHCPRDDDAEHARHRKTGIAAFHALALP